VTYLGALELEFGFIFRERKSLTLDRLQVDDVEVEANFSLARKMGGKKEINVRR